MVSIPCWARCWRLSQPEARWTRLTHSISAKLVLLLLSSMLAVFGLLGT